MEDPNKHHMATLFAMYDDKDASDDMILDQAIYCIRRSHDAITAFMANNRFLEAHRQFQHCEDVLRERNTERRVIQLLPADHQDRHVFNELENRTLHLQKRFEAKRTSAGGVERVGPSQRPSHGGGGVLLHFSHRFAVPTYASSARVTRHQSPKRAVEITSPTNTAASVVLPRPIESQMMVAPSPHFPPVCTTTSTVPAVMRIETDSAHLFPSIERRSSSSTPHPPTTVKPDWRQRSQAHVLRSAEVIERAKETIAGMKKREEELQERRDTLMNAAIVSTQEAIERSSRAAAAEASPRTSQSPQRNDRARSRSKSIERQAELERAEMELARRLESNAQRAAKNMDSKTRGASPKKKPPVQLLPGASFTSLVYRRISNAMRAQEQQARLSPKESGEFHAPEPSMAELRRESELRRLFASTRCDEGQPLDDEANATGTSLDERIKKLGESTATKHLLGANIRQRIHSRVEELASRGKLEATPAEIKMPGEELERFLSAETVQSLKTRRTNTMFFPSLLEPEASLKVTSWSSLNNLQTNGHWEYLSARELMSNLELSVATFRLQRWWRMTSAKIERSRRAANVYLHVTQHHKELDAVDKIVRVLRHFVAHNLVNNIRRRVMHVNDQRIELELNRGFFTEPTLRVSHHRSSTDSRHSSHDAMTHRSSMDDPLHRRSVDGGSPGLLNGTLTLARNSDGDSTNNSRQSRSGGGTQSRRRLRSRLLVVPRASTSMWSIDDDTRPYHNPFPRIHPHHDPLHNIQKKVAARTIMLYIRRFNFRCLEDLQQTVDRCLHHLATGEYHTITLEDDEWRDDQDEDDEGNFAGDPFAGDALLAKYSGNVLERVEHRWATGEADDGITDFVPLKRVKLSELAASEKAALLAVEHEKEAEAERQQRLAEQELLDMQHRMTMAVFIQRVGRGFRRRRMLHRTLDVRRKEAESQGHLPNFGELRIERMSMSLSDGTSGGGHSTGFRESPTAFNTTVHGALMSLIAKRNPDLLPERRDAVQQQRYLNATKVQRWCRSLVSVRVTRRKLLHRHARTIQHWWRAILREWKEERFVEHEMRVDFMDAWA